MFKIFVIIGWVVPRIFLVYVILLNFTLPYHMDLPFWAQIIQENLEKL